jgi:hypothetical protein
MVVEKSLIKVILEFWFGGKSIEEACVAFDWQSRRGEDNSPA